MPFEGLLKEAEQQKVFVYEKQLKQRIKGLYADNVICINRNLPTVAEKACVLAEELGHHYTSHGDILDQRDLRKRKLEIRARSWAYKKIVPLSAFVSAHINGIRNRYELAEMLNVTEEFLNYAINRYREIYGVCVTLEGYTIYFDPLGVLEMFE